MGLARKFGNEETDTQHGTPFASMGRPGPGHLNWSHGPGPEIKRGKQSGLTRPAQVHGAGAFAGIGLEQGGKLFGHGAAERRRRARS